MDTNFTVGTIFGVWPGDKLTGVTGGDQVAAAMGIFGPRTTYVLALKDAPGTHEFLLLDEGKWQHVKDTTSIGEGKMFSPGNLRATTDNPEYAKVFKILCNIFYCINEWLIHMHNIFKTIQK